MLHDTESFAFLLKKLIRRPKTIAAYYRFLRNQYLSHDELLELNWRKRKRLLHHAYDTVPYYRKKFQSLGIHPSDIKNPDVFAKLPFLTKQDVKENMGDLVSTAASPRHLRVSVSGGSSGIPVKVYHDIRSPQAALGWRMLDWWNLRYGVNEGVVWRIIPGYNDDGRAVNHIRRWPTRRVLLDASVMYPADIEDFVRRFNRVRPRLLHGYSGGIDHIAMYVEENKLSIHSPDAIWLTASPVSEVLCRHVETVFKSPVYDQYGSGEINYIASQCGMREKLHIFFDSRHVEFIDEKGLICPVGTTGEIAITDLDNYAFPLIRYLMGDMGKALQDRCSCGINLPLMASVNGRVSDSIRTPDGAFLDGGTLSNIFNEFPEAVRQFQIHQKSDFSIDLYVVPNPSYKNSSEVFRIVKKNLKSATKGQIPVSIIPSEIISPDHGKTRYIVSEVKP